MHKINQKVKIL